MNVVDCEIHRSFREKNTILLNYVELIWFHAAYLCSAQLNFGSGGLKSALLYLQHGAQSLVWISHVARRHRPYFADVNVTSDVGLQKDASNTAFISLFEMELISICCYIERIFGYICCEWKKSHQLCMLDEKLFLLEYYICKILWSVLFFTVHVHFISLQPDIILVLCDVASGIHE